MHSKTFAAVMGALFLSACASGGRVPGSYVFPNSVMADRLSFGVSGVSPSAFKLNMKFALMKAGEEEKPQEPPTDEQWRKAAEQAVPPGCKIEEIKPSDGGEALVTFKC